MCFTYPMPSGAVTYATYVFHVSDVVSYATYVFHLSDDVCCNGSEALCLLTRVRACAVTLI